jgi:hypothetical protein
MSSAARKIKKQNKLIQEKVMLFDAIPKNCTGCNASYDKNNKEQAFSWSVMVFNESKQVKLFCPTCYKDVKAWAEDTVKEADNE